ncbi:hypothetical protein ACFVMC_26315 [Nocardia sp. NPDC127579]|uniref:hypothetical protein n=1 Tax=Nocardia sp. NPDC127579 TaxID=3345402 RepID=UPI003639B57E
MRNRLIQALRPVAPGIATMVADDRTGLTVLPAAWLSGWTLIDAQQPGARHARRVHLALSERAEVQVLTGRPEAFDAVVRGSEPSADTAIAIGRAFLDTTRTFEKWSYRVERPEEIVGLPEHTDPILADLRIEITPPLPVAGPAGWSLRLWTVTGTSLIRHDLCVRRDRTVEDRATVAAPDLAVPDSV